MIPHQLGLDAVSSYLDKASNLPQEQIDFIMLLLEYAATHNFFWFDGQFFHQDRGVAMGAKYAPSLANLFMAKWEEDLVYTQSRPEVTLWARYIDDILLLWDGSETDLSDYMHFLNTNNRGIHLSYEASQEKIHFLDLTVSVSGDSFVTSTYFKPTDRN